MENRKNLGEFFFRRHFHPCESRVENSLNRLKIRSVLPSVLRPLLKCTLHFRGNFIDGNNLEAITKSMGLLWRAALKMASSCGHEVINDGRNRNSWIIPVHRADLIEHVHQRVSLEASGIGKYSFRKFYDFLYYWFFSPSVCRIICKFSFCLEISNSFRKIYTLIDRGLFIELRANRFI